MLARYYCYVDAAAADDYSMFDVSLITTPPPSEMARTRYANNEYAAVSHFSDATDYLSFDFTLTLPMRR